MIEIETKAVLENPADIGSKLAALGYEFSEPIVQEDEIFFRDGDEVKGLWLSKTVLRIRTVNDRHTLTVKQHRCDDSDQFNCREHTTEVSDPAETRELLQLVEYLPLVRVKKTRRKAKQGHTAICLDQVEGLGNFIEVEMLFDDGTDVDASEQQEKMKDFLGQLGISEDQIVKDGYDVMVYEKESGTDRQAA